MTDPARMDEPHFKKDLALREYVHVASLGYIYIKHRAQLIL